MISILEALANDSLCINPMAYKKSAEYAKATKAALETAEALDEKLNDEERELLEQLQDTQSDIEQFYAAERFIRGFRIATLMMLEVFAESSDLFYDKRESRA